MSGVPVFGIVMASIYYGLAFLAFLVSWAMWRSVQWQVGENNVTIWKAAKDVFHELFTWPPQIPHDLKVLLGRAEPVTPRKRAVEPHIGLQMGIGLTSLAWAVAGTVWAETNIGLYLGAERIFFVVVTAFCTLYLLGYMLHLQTIWRERPHRWRLSLLSVVIFVPTLSIIRILLW